MDSEKALVTKCGPSRIKTTLYWAPLLQQIGIGRSAGVSNSCSSVHGTASHSKGVHDTDAVTAGMGDGCDQCGVWSRGEGARDGGAYDGDAHSRGTRNGDTYLYKLLS